MEFRLVHAGVVAGDFWPWFVFVGCVVTFVISVLFPNPPSQMALTEAHVRNEPST